MLIDSTYKERPAGLQPNYEKIILWSQRRCSTAWSVSGLNQSKKKYYKKQNKKKNLVQISKKHRVFLNSLIPLDTALRACFFIFVFFYISWMTNH